MRTKIINSLQNWMVCFLVLILKIDRMFRITFRVLDPKSGHRITNCSCSDGEFPNYRCLHEVFLNVSDFFGKIWTTPELWGYFSDELLWSIISRNSSKPHKARIKNMLVCCHPTGSTRNVRVKIIFWCSLLKNFFLVTDILQIRINAIFSISKW